jgi:hypothetical protein
MLTRYLCTALPRLPRLSLLWAQLEQEYKRFGMYIATNDGSSSGSGPQPRRQAGEYSIPHGHWATNRAVPG